jgi:AcrR family transcriptional regulator
MDERRSRADLLERILADVAAHGLSDRSLRDLARSVGSSHRMLLYHFGSRAGLVRAIVEAVEAGQRQLLVDAAADAGSSAELARRTWRRVSDPAALGFVRLFFELVGQADRDANPDLTGAWLDDLEALAAAAGQPADRQAGRLGIAVVRGLLIDLVTGADRDEVDAAFERYAAGLEAPPPKPDSASAIARRASGVS